MSTNVPAIVSKCDLNESKQTINSEIKAFQVLINAVKITEKYGKEDQGRREARLF